MNKKILFLIIALTLVAASSVFLVDYLALNKDSMPENKIVVVTGQSSEVVNERSEVDFEVEEFATGLKVPWSIVFTGENRLLVSQRPGTIVQIVDGKPNSNPLITFPEVSSRAEEGLMGLAVDPDYSLNKKIYACLAYSGGEGLSVKVVALSDLGTSLEVTGEVISEIPAAQFHAGCRLGFGPDGKLYISTGDASKKELAQRTDSLAGKILRINKDGSTPADNPFSNSPIFALGLRNSQGFDWDESGNLYATDHGPSVFDGPAGGDELNLIKSGANLGWPLVSHEKTRVGLDSPLLVFTPAVAPAGLTAYSGKTLPQYKDNLFFALLRGEGVMRVELDEADPGKVKSYQRILTSYGRIRDIVESPSGVLYFATSNTDGRGKPLAGDDKIFRLTPR
jgi:aldose sugar dehydrogenase